MITPALISCVFSTNSYHKRWHDITFRLFQKLQIDARVFYTHSSNGQYPGSGNSCSEKKNVTVFCLGHLIIIKLNKSNMFAYCSAHRQSVFLWNYFDMALTRSHVTLGPASTEDFNIWCSCFGSAILLMIFMAIFTVIN